MSNQYFQFSFCLKAEPEAALYLSELCRVGRQVANEGVFAEKSDADEVELIKVVEGLMEKTKESGSGVDAKFTDDGVMLFAIDGGFEVGYVAAMLQHYLKKFSNPEPIAFQWSMHDDRGKPDCFGGGAVFITRDQIEFMDTPSWIRERLSSFKPDDSVIFEGPRP